MTKLTERAPQAMVGQRLLDACMDYIRVEDSIAGRRSMPKDMPWDELQAKRWAIIQRLHTASYDALAVAGLEA